MIAVASLDLEPHPWRNGDFAKIIRNILIIGRDTGAFDRAMARDNFDIAAGNNPMLRQMEKAIAAYLQPRPVSAKLRCRRLLVGWTA